jgi:N-acetylornithine carbamoyltransferase
MTAMKDYLALSDLAPEQVRELVALARRLERSPEPQALAGKVLALLFFNPSLRTLASFQSGMSRLGGSSFVISPGQGSWQLETRHGVVMDGAAAEHVKEAIPVLASYADALGIRYFASGTDLAADLADSTFRAMAEVCPVPLVNMESAVDHPCQALGDWKTLDDLAVPQRARFVLTWAWHPKPLPLAVPAAAVHMAALRGMEVVVLRPDGYALPEPIMARARAAAALSGGSVRESEDRAEAMAGARIVYAKSWASPRVYGEAEAEAALRGPLRHWCVDEGWFARAAADARFMHCLPVRRNVVVADEVLDGPRSIVVQQARNRMWAQMAVLHGLLAGTPRGGARRESWGSEEDWPAVRDEQQEILSAGWGSGGGDVGTGPGASS